MAVLMFALQADERGIRIHKPSCEAKKLRIFCYFPIDARFVRWMERTNDD